ncbi:hypothetical protein [Ramlibacter albus]|uniref:DUF2946 domain-containing protein n=1 Tax=Ramlibacter albus TaxID=2079448 RepID=A0A923M9L8_9BURK|nr:hypothetical protein [Ramlibacter albus]MBC5765895.1 hypothetical protein [Ramlibacter albus]
MALRRVLALWLAIALLAAQSLAFVHGVVHAGKSQAQASAVSASWATALFAGHDDDSTCRLFDAVGHDAAPVHVALVLPLAIPAFLFAQLQGGCVHRFSALFEARGPPSVR